MVANQEYLAVFELEIADELSQALRRRCEANPQEFASLVWKCKECRTSQQADNLILAGPPAVEQGNGRGGNA